jgi:hypothetical protein
MAYRERWANPTVLSNKREALRLQARALIVKAVSNVSPTLISGIHLDRGCDLRASLEEKAACVHAFTKWTAFVNRAGTLCHMVPKEGDLHIRIPLFYSTRSLSDARLKAMLWSHVEGRVK